MKKIVLSKLQELQLDTLKEVNRICNKFNIKYYIIAGTLIGAIRHKGFIPWDDDIDIAMMREEYDQFMNCCQGELLDRYSVQNYKTDIDVCHALTRVCIRGTYVDDKYSEHLRFHKEAYIDIFPLDNVPDDNRMLKRQKGKIEIIDRLIKYKACIIHRNGPLFSKYIAKKVIMLLLLPISFKSLQRNREKYMKEYSKEDTLRVCSTASKYGFKKQVMLRSIYGRPTLIEFEGGMYPAPQEWDTYLKQLYGNYFILPSEDKRKPTYDVYEI